MNRPHTFFTDISSNNGVVNIGAYASAGHALISLKSSESVGYVNPLYAAQVHEAHRHGLAVLHYHFARPEHDRPDAEAEHFWSVVHDHFVRPGDYLFVDIETGSPSTYQAFLDAFCHRLQEISGTHPGAYTFLSAFSAQGLVIPSKRWWIAAWGPSRPGSWRWLLPRGQTLFAWQYTDGVVGGVPRSFAGIGTADGDLLNPSVARDLRNRHKK